MQDLLAREDRAPVGDEQRQDLELLLGERDLLAAERADLAPEVHLQLFEPDAVFGRLCRGGASQHAAHAGQHLAHGEGFGYVVVGPEVEPRHGVVFVVPGRAEDHRDIRRLGVRLEHLRHPESADFAHHHVEQDERIAFGVHPEGLFGAVRHIHFVTLDLEIELQDFAQRLFVVHHQNLVFCHSCRSLRIGFRPKITQHSPMLHAVRRFLTEM